MTQTTEGQITSVIAALNAREKPTSYHVHARTVCADGFTMSIQASRYCYCDPRDDEGPYCSFEIGFPSSAEPRLSEYAEDPKAPTETVYGYVPARVVAEVIIAHGGFAKGGAA